MPEWYDEPFANSSQIPTYLISAMTRRHVTVVLSGDGGDELFAGYNRYRTAQRIGQVLSLPRWLRKGAAAALQPNFWISLFSVLPSRLRPPQIGVKLHNVAALLEFDSADALYRRLVSHWEPAEIYRKPASLTLSSKTKSCRRNFRNCSHVCNFWI